MVLTGSVSAQNSLPEGKNTDRIDVSIEKAGFFDRFSSSLLSVSFDQSSVEQGDTVTGEIYGSIDSVSGPYSSSGCNGENVDIRVAWYNPSGRNVATDWLSATECTTQNIDYSFDVWDDAEPGEWEVQAEYRHEDVGDLTGDKVYDFGSDTYEVIDPATIDSDGDGVNDVDDEFPNDPNCTEDSDGDTVCDSEDEFPNDDNCVEDSDGDGVCDNKDDFPNDPSRDTETDSDGDGVFDSNDECPNQGDQGFGLKDNGCPVPDSDGDGVGDRNDSCPRTGDQGFGVKDNGCPIKDSDSDGVADPNDEFPNDPGCVKDSDGDGVCDSKDEFPNDPSRSNFVDEDDDGVRDRNDECVDAPGSKSNGCPTLDEFVIQIFVPGWMQGDSLL